MVLFLHGGGYVFGSPTTHLMVTARLAHERARCLFALDYRLAPEYPYPAAVKDAWAAYSVAAHRTSHCPRADCCRRGFGGRRADDSAVAGAA